LTAEPRWATISAVPTPRRFSRPVLAALEASKILGVRAGLDEHRFTGVWLVTLNGRLFVRSWNDKRTGWREAFRADARGAIQVPPLDREILVRARPVRGERLLAAIDRAYADKYDTRASLKWVRGFARERRRATTTELVPR
jgi:hypothetical protein